MAPRKLIGQHATQNGRVHVAEGAYTSEDGARTRLRTRTNEGAYCDWGAYASGGARTPLPGARTLKVLMFLLEIHSPWLNTVESGFDTILVHTHYFSENLIIRISMQRAHQKENLGK